MFPIVAIALRTFAMAIITNASPLLGIQGISTSITMIEMIRAMIAHALLDMDMRKTSPNYRPRFG
jgi:hypothetical protein